VLLQKVSERQSPISQKAVFFDIEWANAPDDAAVKLIDDPPEVRRILLHLIKTGVAALTSPSPLRFSRQILVLDPGENTSSGASQSSSTTFSGTLLFK
jgi:hypothetical protein